ncbi:50S ribosomal protein L13 [candidate division WOR-1 bacterium RIFOXYA12_FULL_52_29]|uniref:Large ribosomal subunit protein uL13 n=1 Tax=candidate division WOR-1 bacterium RIFOXYC12_FULL_54_18 TaxID=1802584 RepID=A0A1F4T601_UNCSA|nr:MAG: 50S ribosomal protein L13 [candidate division WOR-1 bacterium RIFOXYA2_FULL_51_19]OGC17563.1 MAG: 50S ribosomal protein L13 [candidate division WOR-1 bacterium RIFOXYA12_FULL_52_29]OGC26420.1 MAG: 50S ribosomal protein L13 [candidate division WOR-1 bacterium RIFOXYB2_FULL_45_9]OGC27980.1 MAG: 50S ribosomal protein L13 [candidate division WOR-1 bacterium RIFOXYC12_FULL_54_18]OGC29734.1 MAG: 50S ribosomal protein L13 [candidate division WOR-1 bacterium RIFOXYB12_FULL_52_16]
MKKNNTIFANDKMVKRKWFRVDASGKVLGRLATKVAVYLRGKHKTLYTPQTDCGDYIVVVNADKVKVTGNKLKDKTYFTHSGYPGGDKTVSLEKMLQSKPEQVIRLAITGMLPHTRLGARIVRKLKIFTKTPAQYAKIPELEV